LSEQGAGASAIDGAGRRGVLASGCFIGASTQLYLGGTHETGVSAAPFFDVNVARWKETRANSANWNSEALTRSEGNPTKNVYGTCHEFEGILPPRL
jgi:hypothetical protein